MFLSMNWISDFVDLSGLDKVELIHQFSLSTAEVENEIFFKGSELSGVVVAEIKSKITLILRNCTYSRLTQVKANLLM